VVHARQRKRRDRSNPEEHGRAGLLPGDGIRAKLAVQEGYALGVPGSHRTTRAARVVQRACKTRMGVEKKQAARKSYSLPGF